MNTNDNRTERLIIMLTPDEKAEVYRWSIRKMLSMSDVGRIAILETIREHAADTQPTHQEQPA